MWGQSSRLPRSPKSAVSGYFLPKALESALSCALDEKAPLLEDSLSGEEAARLGPRTLAHTQGTRTRGHTPPGS